jgi:hypothetical protein
MIRVVHPGSGSRGHKGTGSRIRNTGWAARSLSAKMLTRRRCADVHQRTHEEKPVVCPYCEMRFSLRFGLKKHVKIHR